MKNILEIFLGILSAVGGFVEIGGLTMIVFVVVAVAGKPDWGQVAAGLVPGVPQVTSSSEYYLYAYFCVALLSSIILPYETYFYASGVIEDKWTAKDVMMNRV